MPLLSHPLSTEEATLLVSVIDLTSLSDDDDDEKIAQLCQQATTPFGDVAAVCAYPQFVAAMREHLSDSIINIATVANFPMAKDDLQTCINSIKKSISEGANEIDIVMPYHGLIEDEASHQNVEDTENYVKACRLACGDNVTLKVILETGALQHNELIRLASQIAIDAGADFIKTSTGKINIGATIEAVKTMLSVIKENSRPVGLKVSGGISTIEQAQQYLHLVTEEMGEAWVDPTHFRIGASSLLQKILDQGKH